MNKLKYSTIITVLFITLLSVCTQAQDMIGDGQQDPPKLALSINAGTTFSYTDVKPQKNGLLVGVGAAFFATPYLHINLDGQKGWLKGGEQINTSGVMGSDNSFFTGTLTVRFVPLMLLQNNKNKALNFFSGIYGGTGAGFISNSVKSNTIVSAEFGSLGGYSGFSFMVPIEAGINVPVAKMGGNSRLLFNLNYRVNLCMSDKIDGYVPTVPANEKNDAYNSLTAGLVFNF